MDERIDQLMGSPAAQAALQRIAWSHNSFLPASDLQLEEIRVESFSAPDYLTLLLATEEALRDLTHENGAILELDTLAVIAGGRSALFTVRDNPHGRFVYLLSRGGHAFAAWELHIIGAHGR